MNLEMIKDNKILYINIINKRSFYRFIYDICDYFDVKLKKKYIIVRHQ